MLVQSDLRNIYLNGYELYCIILTKTSEHIFVIYNEMFDI